ncbi:MAG: hypothetical protein GXY83_33060 [Rhodopirellula sp.]|nr:hypothetical protein [Rhodopirellula sp.]
MTLKYDAWNRLVEVKDGQTVVGKYEYDGQNRRIKKHIDSQSPAGPNGIDRYEHFFYNSQWQVLETRDTTNIDDQAENLQPKYQYVWSARYIDAPVLRDKNADADELCDDERIYYLGDANYNVTCLVDTGGDAVEQYLYDAYGKVTIYDGAWSIARASSSYSVSHGYTGRELDGETDIYNYRNRYYYCSIGRFISRDPIARDVNFYQYCGNSPGIHVDPHGTLTVTPLAGDVDIGCGDMTWYHWDFRLDRAAPCDGYIVQQVDYRCTIKECKDCPNSSPRDSDFSFWEAWFVEKGDLLHRDWPVLGHTDRSSKVAKDKKCGSVSSVGTIKFFCETTTGYLGLVGVPVRGGWTVGAVYGTGDCRVSPRELPSTGRKPSWWDKEVVEGPAIKSHSVHWNCCCHDKSDFARAHATPKR